MIISRISSEILSQQFELCGVTKNSYVALLTDDIVNEYLQSNSEVALKQLGCRFDTFNIQWDQKNTTLMKVQNEIVHDDLAHSDLVIDLSSGLSDEIIKHSTLSEKLIISIPTPSFEPYSHSMTSAGVMQRAQRINALLENTDSLTIESASGTKLRFSSDDLVHSSHTGVPIEGGVKAGWPSGCVEFFSHMSNLDAEIVLMPGDIIDNALHLVKSPVVLQIRGGNIVEIIGESSDANILKVQLESFSDREHAYRVKGFNIGLLFFNGDYFSGPFDPKKVNATGSTLRGGWTTLTFGSDIAKSLSITLTSSNLLFDNVEVFLSGDFAATMKPDIYELALMGL
ncbi:MAG: hypothetical protein CL431_02450 [Acidimicrobiaceae bacterium]|jgi:hypothetical protein|nr:hypothetical protein [Acidimicrobiaceae bacterium]|tara:strand:+ start:2280 stop:3302 length:1023 start_codon:yes stop_codon:yes gene_type:complete